MNNLKNYLEKQNMYRYLELRQSIIQECNVSRATFSNWRNGKVEPSLKYKNIINQVSGVKIY